MKKLFPYLLFLFSAPAFCQQKTATQQAAINLFTQNKDEEAIAIFQKALQENPKDIYSLNALGVIYNRNNKYAEEYESSAKGLLVTNNNGQPFILQHAEAGLEIGKAAEALKLLDSLVMQGETLPFIPTAHYLRGRALDKLERIREAISAYSKCIQIKSDFENAYYYRGDDFNNISRYANALTDFNTYIKVVGDFAPAYNDRALSFYKLGRYEEAIADYAKSIALNPAYYQAFCNRGDVYMDVGKIELAKADYQAVLNKTDIYAGAYWGMGQALYKEKIFKDALPMAEKAIRMQPKMAPYLSTYGFTLIGLDREKEAIAIADRILAIDDKNSDGWIMKASCYSNLSDFNAGISTLTSGIEKLPNNYLLYMLRASIYRFAHNEAAAAIDDAKAKELSTK